MCFIYNKAVSFWFLQAKLESTPVLPTFGVRKQLVSPLKMFLWSLKFSLLRPPPNSSHLFLEEPVF